MICNYIDILKKLREKRSHIFSIFRYFCLILEPARMTKKINKITKTNIECSLLVLVSSQNDAVLDLQHVWKLTETRWS